MAKDHLPRLRADPLLQPPHLVLVDPEIPQNTGNIARLAGALACPLHLVGTLGFQIDDKAVRRAGLDYWHLVDIRRHADLADFGRAEPNARQLFFTAVAERSYLDAAFRPSDALIFGRESRGLDEELLAANSERCFALPTIGAVRSLNLANCVAVVAYEAMRQLHAFEGATLR
jgi:tRNA (cytidine/uridine-2'-O-)-methyltransferase